MKENFIQTLATPSSLPLGNSSKLDCSRSLVTFENQAFGQIRTVLRNGEPWFVGKDVASALGYVNTNDALAKRVENEDKGVANCDTLGGKQLMTIINESGVYSLIFSSQLPEAKAFKHWVTNEVLPSIRKNGMYATDRALRELLEDPEHAVQLFKTIMAERESTEESDILYFMKRTCDEMEHPCEDYYKEILWDRNPILAQFIAPDYGMSAESFNELLAKMNIQHKVEGEWTPYSQFFNEGYVERGIITTNDSQKSVIFWTQKGRILIFERLKASGIYPITFIS